MAPTAAGRMSPGEEDDHSAAKTNHHCQTALSSRSHDAADYDDDPGREIQEEEQESYFYLGGKQPTATDGGWAWVVLVAAMIVASLTTAFPSCIAIFQADLQVEFSISNTETAWADIMTFALYAGGPLCSVLVERYSCGATVIVGGLLSGLSMAAFSQATTITQIYIMSGFTGLGFCLSFQPSVTIVGHYFVRRRVFATSLLSTGSAVGMICIPLLAQTLLCLFSWRSSFLILGGLVLNCCLCGAVMRPVTSGRNNLNKEAYICPQKETKGLKDRTSTALRSFLAFLQTHLALDLIMSNAYYRAYCLSETLMMLALPLPFNFLAPYAVQHNISPSSVVLLKCILLLVNFTMRPVIAIVMGLPRFRGRSSLVNVWCGAALIGGLNICISAASASFEALLVFVVIRGLSMSVIASLRYTVLVDLVELSRFSSALGLLCLLESVALLIGPALAGVLVDLTGQYSYVFYAASMCVSCASLYLAGFFYFLNGKRDKEKKNIKKPSEGCLLAVIKIPPERKNIRELWVILKIKLCSSCISANAFGKYLVFKPFLALNDIKTF